jgi:site-specific recombinase XerD
MRYRQFYGLQQLPQHDDPNDLFMNLNGTKGITANMIYRLVKKTFLNCAETFKINNPMFASKLIKASTHWLRHTSITHQTDAGIELRYIKRSARHESVETTMLYQHAEEDQWHEAMTRHNIKS